MDAPESNIRAIQGLVRSRKARKILKFKRHLAHYRKEQKCINKHLLHQLIIRSTRDQESQYMHRYAYGKIEVDQIVKYIGIAE